MEDQDLQLMEGLGRNLPTHTQNFETHPFVRCHSPPKKWVLPRSFMSQLISPLMADLIFQKGISNSFYINFIKHSVCGALFSFIIMTYSWVLNRQDFPLIDYSVFCHPPQPYSALPVYWFGRILPASRSIPESPFISLCAQSTVVAGSLGEATKLFDVHVLKHDVYKHIQAQVWWFFKHMFSIMLSLTKYYYVKHFSG